MRPSLSVTVSFDGLPATTWWLVRIRPFASKMTPEPMAVPWPVWPVVGSVSVTPSAVIVTTAGLTCLTMSTSEPPWPAAGAGCWVEGVVLPVVPGWVAGACDAPPCWPVVAGACVGVTAPTWAAFWSWVPVALSAR